MFLQDLHTLQIGTGNARWCCELSSAMSISSIRPVISPANCGKYVQVAEYDVSPNLNSAPKVVTCSSCPGVIAVGTPALIQAMLFGTTSSSSICSRELLRNSAKLLVLGLDDAVSTLCYALYVPQHLLSWR